MLLLKRTCYVACASMSDAYRGLLAYIHSSASKERKSVADPEFWIRGVKFKKFRPKPPILCNVTVGLHCTHEMIEINMNIEICESRIPTPAYSVALTQ